MTDTLRASAKQQIESMTMEMHAAAEKFQGIGLGVSIFGSARIPRDHPFYRQALELGTRIARLGVPLIAGGGPGLMEAANRGATEAGGRSVGLNIRLPHETTGNHYQTDSLYFEYFNSRKASFFMHSLAYIVLPGGFGTLDELFEALTMIQTEKHPPAPVILLGTEFWAGMMDWARDQLVRHDMVDRKDLDQIILTDDLDEVIAHIRYALHREPERAPALPTG